MSEAWPFGQQLHTAHGKDRLYTGSDPHFKLNAHVNVQALPRINILKALADTNLGQQKETILNTYKSLIRSLFMYAAPIWFPNTSPETPNYPKFCPPHSHRLC